MHNITLVSSQNPNASEEMLEHQRNAKASWDNLGVRIVLVEAKGPPTIKSLLEAALITSPDFIMLVNGDIILTPRVLELTQVQEKHQYVWAATSLRHYPGKGVIDLGLDFFAFPVNVARHVAKDIPDFLTIGRGLWDNWMNGYLARNLIQSRYFDLTYWGCVIHPDHSRPPVSAHSNYTEEQSNFVLTHPRIVHAGLPREQFHG